MPTMRTPATKLSRMVITIPTKLPGSRSWPCPSPEQQELCCEQGEWIRRRIEVSWRRLIPSLCLAWLFQWLACAVLFLIALRLGSDISAAAFGALSLGLATPMWAYSTLFWGHSLAAACLVFGFAFAL